MREAFGYHVALRLHLEPVVAHGGSRAESFLDVALLEDIPMLFREVSPHPGEAFCLKLLQDR